MKWKIVHLDETDSTNQWLKEHGGDENVCVVSDYQKAGRGCGTNSWESERGKNLTFSLLTHPTEIPANRQFQISEAISVAICQTLALYHIDKVAIKWPNDIYVDDRKLCGILIENRLQGTSIQDSIIGIGLNVNQQSFKSDAPNPVSLYQLLGQETDRQTLLEAFLERVEPALNSKTTCFTYKEMLYRRHKPYLYRTKTSCFTATLMDVMPDGRLLLLDEQGLERSFGFKEVEFVI